MLSDSSADGGGTAGPRDAAEERALAAAVGDRERLGARLRDLRLASGMSLRALAGDLGISASAVSQIERGAMQPSVGRLIAMVGALGVPLSAVFDESAPAPALIETAVVRAGEVAPVTLDGGVLFRRLAPGPIDAVDFFESTYPPGSTSTAHRQFLRHDGFEVGTVTLGELTVEFEDEIVVLAAGDAITFPCERPHRMVNRGTGTAIATWLIVHR
ncbi:MULTISPECIES: helix-turn-helix domain-containing protein [unclassified Rathayibacter]|uniref:helix-turn-helix domain-containing protein n=1 Tax=unclassified Rathayibacter TaxID=2609250 RepID=UPI0006F49D68|nr:MULTISPECIES: helix-turn-helix domain-containing protein [unclassified Rathayibacter]KQQ03761.1 transcriptional regulator [Rathayibacter sp. Leaf294]KQS12218.1 transcriptional regulator [Rathayibacter sp. Leaf185]